MTHPVLTALGLGDNESGTYLGNGEWSKTRDAGVLEPVNPTDGNVLARVPAYGESLAAVRTPTELIAEPFERFLVLEQPAATPSRSATR